MTLCLLLLKFKQKGKQKVKRKRGKAEKNEANPSEWIRKISEIFYESWKISERWLLIIKNSLSKVVDHELLTILDSGKQILDRSVMIYPQKLELS